MSDTTKINNKTHYALSRERRRIRIQTIIQQWKHDVGCGVCKEDEPVCLDLHHIDHTSKDIHPSNLIRGSVVELIKEFSKCIVVCKNCHTKIHNNKINCPVMNTKIDLLETTLNEHINAR